MDFGPIKVIASKDELKYVVLTVNRFRWVPNASLIEKKT